MATDFDSFDESGAIVFGSPRSRDAFVESPLGARNLGQIATIPPDGAVGVPIIIFIQGCADTPYFTGSTPETENVLFMRPGGSSSYPNPQLNSVPGYLPDGPQAISLADDIAFLASTLVQSSNATWDRRGWFRPNWIIVLAHCVGPPARFLIRLDLEEGSDVFTTYDWGAEDALRLSSGLELSVPIFYTVMGTLHSPDQGGAPVGSLIFYRRSMSAEVYLQQIQLTFQDVMIDQDRNPLFPVFTVYTGGGYTMYNIFKRTQPPLIQGTNFHGGPIQGPCFAVEHGDAVTEPFHLDLDRELRRGETFINIDRRSVGDSRWPRIAAQVIQTQLPV
jgi:hypothetical protein